MVIISDFLTQRNKVVFFGFNDTFSPEKKEKCNGSQSKDSPEDDTDSIVVGGFRLKMVDADTLPGGGHGLVLEDIVNASVEPVRVALVSKPQLSTLYLGWEYSSE